MTGRWSPVAIMATLLAVTACTGNECYENHSALPLAAFYNAATLQPVTVQRLAVYGIGAPGDSVLYMPQALAEAYLPFRVWQDTTQYVFAYASGYTDSISTPLPPQLPKDTITFVYKPKEWFVSPACGAMYFYEMKDVWHTDYLIDSIAYKDLITNENVANIKIFFKEGD